MTNLIIGSHFFNNTHALPLSLHTHKTIKERKKDQEQVREKHFCEMKKKNVGMTVVLKSKEIRVGMKERNGIDLSSVYPANNP